MLQIFLAGNNSAIQQIILIDITKMLFSTQSVTITLIQKMMTAEESSTWNDGLKAKLIVLVDGISGKQFINRPSDAENSTLDSKHPFQLVYNALITVSLSSSDALITHFL